VEMTDKIKFRIGETKDDLMKNIVQLLPQIETEWTKVTSEGKPYFTSQIGNVKFVIKQHEVDIIVIRETRDGKLEDKKTISATMANNKPVSSKLYTIISKRFDEEDDIKFYKEIHECISTLVGECEQPKETTEDDATKQTKFLRDFT
jgi:hypothetical protein